jgi:hypothetical protein
MRGNMLLNRLRHLNEAVPLLLGAGHWDWRLPVV